MTQTHVSQMRELVQATIHVPLLLGELSLLWLVRSQEHLNTPTFLHGEVDDLDRLVMNWMNQAQSRDAGVQHRVDTLHIPHCDEPGLKHNDEPSPRHDLGTEDPSTRLILEVLGLDELLHILADATVSKRQVPEGRLDFGGFSSSRSHGVVAILVREDVSTGTRVFEGLRIVEAVKARNEEVVGDAFSCESGLPDPGGTTAHGGVDLLRCLNEQVVMSVTEVAMYRRVSSYQLEIHDVPGSGQNLGDMRDHLRRNVGEVVPAWLCGSLLLLGLQHLRPVLGCCRLRHLRFTIFRLTPFPDRHGEQKEITRRKRIKVGTESAMEARAFYMRTQMNKGRQSFIVVV